MSNQNADFELKSTRYILPDEKDEVSKPRKAEPDSEGTIEYVHSKPI